MKKCICFARVSTEQQDLTAQLEAVCNAAKCDGYTNDDIITVEGKESAIALKEEERQTLNDIKELISLHPTIESIYFFAVDRLSRRMSVIMSIKEWADENKLNLVFLNPHRMQTLRKNEMGEWIEDELTTLLLAMLSYGAQMEMKTKKARFKVVKDSMRAQGKLAEGRVALGYKLDENKYVVPDEGGTADVIRNIFNDYLTGEYSITKLHNKYVKKGVFEVTTIVATQKRRIYAILTNPAYCGERVESKQKNPKTGKKYESSIQYPAIITKELFEATQEMLHAKKKGVKGESKHIYYAKGLIKCHCGHSMIPKSAKVSYSCESYGHNMGINLNVIDSIVWFKAKCLFNYYTTLNKNEQVATFERQLADYEQEIRLLEEKVDIEAKEEARLLNMYLKGRMKEEDFEEKQDVIRKNINAFERQITGHRTNIQQIVAVLETIDKEQLQITELSELSNTDAVNELDNLSDSEKVNIIKKVIKEVRCSKFTDIDGIEKIRIDIIPVDLLVEFDGFTKYYYKYWITDSKNGKKMNLVRMDLQVPLFVGNAYVKENWVEYTNTDWLITKRFVRTDGKKNKAVE